MEASSAAAEGPQISELRRAEFAASGPAIAPLANVVHEDQAFHLGNLRVEALFRALPKSGSGILEPVCSGIRVRCFAAYGGRCVGELELVGGAGTDALICTLHELLDRAEALSKSNLDERHGGVSKDFVKDIVAGALNQGCEVRSSFGGSASEIAARYEAELLAELPQLGPVRDTVEVRVDMKSGRALSREDSQGVPGHSHVLRWIDIDLGIPKPLNETDDLWRALHAAPDFLKKLGMSGLDIDQPVLLDLRQFYVHPGDATQVDRHKAFAIFGKNLLVTLHDGSFPLVADTRADLARPHRREAAASPATLYLDLFERCLDANQKVVDGIENGVIEKLEEEIHSSGVLSAQSVRMIVPKTLQTLRHLARKIEESGGRLSSLLRLADREEGTAIFGSQSRVCGDRIARMKQDVTELVSRFHGSLARTKECQEANNTSIARNTEDKAQKIAVLGAVVLPLTFAATFGAIPEVPWTLRLGTLIGSGLLSVGLIAAGRWRHWL